MTSTKRALASGPDRCATSSVAFGMPVAVALPKPQHKKGEPYHRTRYDGVKVWARHR